MSIKVESAAVVGVSGAASLAFIELLIGRVSWLNGSPLGRTIGRLAVAGATAYVADRLDAPEDVTTGVIAGAVMASSLDVGVALVGTKRLDPPAVVSAGQLGDPWAPRPPYLPG